MTDNDHPLPEPTLPVNCHGCGRFRHGKLWDRIDEECDKLTVYYVCVHCGTGVRMDRPILTDGGTSESGNEQCNQCGEEIETGLVCSDCEERMDGLISAFAALNNRSSDTDRRQEEESA